jgi:tRNA threonylcarbamoyladenosine biosynthesis protein TsaB
MAAEMADCILAFDCSVTGLGVAVVRDGEALARHRSEGRDQAATLLPAVADVLERAGVARAEVTLLAVTTGPGSFTGVRVGLAAARGLALALARPLAGIATTDVLLAQVPRQRGIVVAAIDSRLGDWFCALSNAEDGDGSDRTPFIASAAQLAARLGGRRATIVGPDAGRLAAEVPDTTAEQAMPDPVVLARLAATERAAAWRDRNLRDGLPKPLYLRGVNVTSPDGTRRTVE